MSFLIYNYFWFTCINIYIYTGFSWWIKERHRWHWGIFAVVRHVSFASQNILVNWKHVLCSGRTILTEHSIIDDETSFSTIKMIAKMELICAEIWFIRNVLVCFLYTRNNIQFDLKNFSFDQSFFCNYWNNGPCDLQLTWTAVFVWNLPKILFNLQIFWTAYLRFN